MISIVAKGEVLLEQEYPELNDPHWAHVGGFKNKMIEWTGDQHYNRNFNNHIYNLKSERPLRVLDLGCGGGGFIENCLEDGNIGVGIDGNRYFKELNLHGWSRYNNNFFCCDLGKEWQLSEDGKPMKFDIITTWEFLEHLYENVIETLSQCIANHSKDGTYLIYSASQRDHRPHHKLVRNKEWWLNQFGKYGFINTDLDFGRDVIRWEHDSIFGYMKFQEKV